MNTIDSLEVFVKNNCFLSFKFTIEQLKITVGWQLIYLPSQDLLVQTET